MKTKHLIIVIFSLLLCINAEADTIVKLTSGKEFIGTVERENDDVVIIRTHQNKVYQFPRADVMEMTEQVSVEQEEVKQRKTYFGIRIHLGGAMTMKNPAPLTKYGYAVCGGLQMGAANLFDRNIFLGAGIGIDGCSIAKSYIFIPLTITLSVPLMQTQDTPFVGLEGGYGFGVKGVERGGFKGGVSIGWTHRCNKRLSTNLALYAGMQQAVMNTSENIAYQDYTYSAHRILPQFGLRFCLQL